MKENRELKVGKEIRCGVAGERIPIRTPEALEVARWFGLGKLPRRSKRRPNTARADAMPRLDLTPGTITLITGPSGAGKSMLLRKLRAEHSTTRRWVDLNELAFEQTPIVNCFGDQPLRQTLELLSRVGLGEAWSYLRTPSELSEGQKFRLRLAAGLWKVGAGRPNAGEARDAASLSSGGEQSAILACDEFAAVLDRLTAMIVAHCLRRAIDATGNVAAVVATSHEDLTTALCPDVVVRCDFGRLYRE